MTKDEDPAVIPGTFPDTSGGLLMTVLVLWLPACVAKDDCETKGDCVDMTELVELDRVGDEGRVDTVAVAVWEGSETAGLEGVRWWFSPGNGEGGQTLDVGVGMGVFCEEREMDGCVATPSFAEDESRT
jgi:hypothetical protein